MTIETKERFCDCPECPCNVPTDDNRDCADCMAGNHIDWTGKRSK